MPLPPLAWVRKAAASIVREKRLPQKLLIVHQFLEGMIQGKSRLVKRRELALVINVGAPKEASRQIQRVGRANPNGL